jgi:single-stranded-DNA-specific exonuclease
MTAAPPRWAVAPPSDPAQVDPLVHALNVPETLASLLVQRGFTSPVDAKRYLRPELESLSDPYALRDMQAAVELVSRAAREGRTVLVHGDYDVDGQCATALLTRVLREAGAHVVPFVPHRIRDGYDFGAAGLAEAREHGASLIVTCDCGTTAVEPIRQAREEGMDVVVTDHHLPGVVAPANAVVNPQHPDCTAALGHLCGAGVAFKLAQALVDALGLPDNLPFHFLDLVALATVADVVPLTGENRTLVRFGLKMLAASRWRGVRALVDTAGLAGRELRAGQVGYIIAPRLNAAGRIGEAMDGVRLLLCDDDEEARDLARSLERINEQRQAVDETMLDQALEEIDAHVDLDRDYGLVLAREGWHAGVIGLVASRVVERYARPAILVSLDGEEGRGSGRSIAGFDLHGALEACAPQLERYGGHKMAAGLTLRRERLQGFREAFGAVARERLTPQDLVPTQRIDAVVSLERMDAELESLLRHLEPCGPGNPAPVFGVSRSAARDRKTVGANHLKFTLDDGTGRIEAIAFNWADRVESAWWGAPLDVALRLERNEWRGRSHLQARVVGIRPS